MNLENIVKYQIESIENGNPLEAFTKFFSDKVTMRSNDALFTNDKKKGMELQTEFIKNISAFKATVYDAKLNNKISTVGFNNNFKNSYLVNFAGF